MGRLKLSNMEKPTTLNKLTDRESEVAELLAWGATKKEAAKKLFLSHYTVDNHLRNIFIKTGTNKVNELSAWWFCTRFKISMDLNPLKKQIIAIMLLLIIIPATFNVTVTDNYSKRRNRARTEIRTIYRRTEKWQEIQL